MWEEVVEASKPYLRYKVVPKDEKNREKSEEECGAEAAEAVEGKATALCEIPAAAIPIGSVRTFQITFVDTGFQSRVQLTFYAHPYPYVIHFSGHSPKVQPPR